MSHAGPSTMVRLVSLYCGRCEIGDGSVMCKNNLIFILFLIF